MPYLCLSSNISYGKWFLKSGWSYAPVRWVPKKFTLGGALWGSLCVGAGLNFGGCEMLNYRSGAKSVGENRETDRRWSHSGTHSQWKSKKRNRVREHGWHFSLGIYCVFFSIIKLHSVSIGSGLFYQSGQYLSLGGPDSLFLAYIFMGSVSIVQCDGSLEISKILIGR